VNEVNGMSQREIDEKNVLDTQTAGQSGRSQSSADSSMGGAAITEKVCCVCGTDLHGRTRFRDGQGRYWCPGCNEKDQQSRMPANCPDCNAQFMRADLVEFKGTPVCKACWEKRKLSAKREDARIEAAAEAAREDEERRKRWIMLGIGLAVILALWGLGLLTYWLMS
jgi:hypothetical protein